jgi:hypothetical protein
MKDKKPSDLVNFGALPDTAPPKGKNAPKKGMTREQSAAQMRRAGQKPKAYAKGGSVTRADGMCSKGHTKGKMV